MSHRQEGRFRGRSDSAFILNLPLAAHLLRLRSLPAQAFLLV
jgi:hypothetical protein